MRSPLSIVSPLLEEMEPAREMHYFRVDSFKECEERRKISRIKFNSTIDSSREMETRSCYVAKKKKRKEQFDKLSKECDIVPSYSPLNAGLFIQRAIKRTKKTFSFGSGNRPSLICGGKGWMALRQVSPL